MPKSTKTSGRRVIPLATHYRKLRKQARALDPAASKAFIVFTPYIDAQGEPAAQVACSTEGPFNDANLAHQAMKAVTDKINEILLGEALARQTLGTSLTELERVAGAATNENTRLVLPLALAKERNEREAITDDRSNGSDVELGTQPNAGDHPGLDPARA